MANLTINIPEGFLNEEVRCGHKVTSETKKVWAVELDLLYVFQKFCSNHNLKWFMAYGSLIGAVRHKGFIPWDNDIDVIMPRDDFDKFCELAPTHFMHPYFFQTPITEHGNYYKSYAKLCNSETTGCSEIEWLQGINGGIFIDIFVLDSIPSNKCILNYYQRKINHISHYARFLNPYSTSYSGIKLIKNTVWFLLWKVSNSIKGDSIFSIVQKHCRALGNYSGSQCSFLANGIKSQEIWLKDWWEGYNLATFEFLDVNIPKDYDAILRTQYGEYMSFPAKNERVTHDYLIFNADISYKHFFEQK